jgi:hypothetical protein
MSRIKNFREFLILETTEFNLQRLNSDSGAWSMHVDDPALSVNAFDKHQDAIRAGVSRVNSILQSLSNSSAYRSLKSKFALEDQKITSMKILRMVNVDDVNYDAFISFVIDGEEYFGQVKNVLSLNPKVVSEVFFDTDLVQSEEWNIRTKGLIVKTIHTWLHPEEGKYKLLSDSLICYDNQTGEAAILKKDIEVEVTNSFDFKIIIRYNNKYYTLMNKNFVYFNYWFTKV